MPTQEHLDAEAKFIKSQGLVCPWCDFKVDEHAKNEDELKNVKTKCKLTQREVPIWTAVRRPQQPGQ
jgi:agmatine/peptidylarginine deiminase